MKRNVSLGFLFLLLPVFFILFVDYAKTVNDVWFLFSHGKYVLEHGFPHTEFLTIHENLHFVMQQWGFSVIIFLIYKFTGNIGVYFFIFFINLLILFFLYKLCMLLSSNNKYFSCLIAAITDLFLEMVFIAPRPQLISLLLLIITIYILELFFSGKAKSIWFIPLISLILINIHAAYWPMLFIVILPYLAESLFFLFKKNDKKLYNLLIIFFIAILMGFINPYGIEAMIYSFYSYGIEEFNVLIREMHPVAFKGPSSVIVPSLIILLVIIVNLLFIIKNRKNVSIHQLLLFLGFSFMAFLNLKNFAFLIIGTIPFLVCFFKKNFKSEISIFIILTFLPIFLIIFLINNNQKQYLIRDDKNSKIVDYLDKNANKKIKLYTDFDDGSYYEYHGYKCYIDSRAEVFIKSINHKEDIFHEYYLLFTGKIKYENFINKYNFDYMVINKKSDLYKYISHGDVYKKVITSNDRCLFVKSN